MEGHEGKLIHRFNNYFRNWYKK